MDASMRDALAEVEKDRSQLSGVIVSRLFPLPHSWLTQIYAGLPQAFLANALVRVKARSRVKARLRCKGKAEKEQTLVGAVKETRNSNNRGKTGLCSTYNSRRMYMNLS